MTHDLSPSRGVERLVVGQATQDGAGVKLVRLLGPELQRRLDPFLMLDAFGSDRPDDYIAGFPDHPHRGFETITLMIAGRMRHRDSAGHEGLLEPGGLQWMTAGRGLVHSEMPQQADGRMEGFQLWLNLPAARKMCEPWYRDFAATEVPTVSWQGGRARVIAGELGQTPGAVQREQTEPLVLDLTLDAGTHFEQVLPVHHNAFVVVYRGALEIAGRRVTPQQLAILDNRADAQGVTLEAGAEGAQALLVAGAPLHEPIVQHGPFVMNSREQIYQAVEDFRRGVLA
jgi:redox-sensitive bicupin YhaK (pirin superfamily)